MNAEASQYVHYSLPKSVLRNYLRKYFPLTGLGSICSYTEIQKTINARKRYHLVMAFEYCIQELHLNLSVIFNPTFTILIKSSEH